MRATLSGLCKLASINYPLESEVENIAVSVRMLGCLASISTHGSPTTCLYARTFSLSSLDNLWLVS
jgi:hypothetical protein